VTSHLTGLEGAAVARLREVTTVIWDFNGTLIDDLDLVVWSVNAQLTRRGLSPLTPSAYRDVFGFPIEDYYRRIGLGFETETMAELAADFFAEYAPKLGDCGLHDGVPEVLGAFSDAGIRQFVLSAMEEGMLRSMLAHLGIASFFEGIYGLAHQEGDSKLTRGAELLRDFEIDPASAMMIGDTDHDAEVAAALGLSTALVASGHQSKRRLREAGAAVFQDAQAIVDAWRGNGDET